MRQEELMSENIIETKDLAKVFNGDIKAVDKVSFSVGKGEIFGFLGPNGAGKTTTILMLITLLQPTSGTATVCGFDIVHNQHDVRCCLGYVSQDTAVDDDLTGLENLRLQSGFYHLSKKIADERTKEVLEMVDLSDRASEMVGNYSGGMRKRLDIASGLIHRPRILFLDEPTLGLDIQTRVKIWDYVEKLRTEQEITIFVTTHYMDEADFLCDRVAIIDHGVIKALDTPDHLKNALGGDILQLELGQSNGQRVEEIRSKLEEMPAVHSTKPENGKLLLYVKDGEVATPKIFSLLDDMGVSIQSMLLKKPSLDDVFLHHTGRALRDESGNREEARISRLKMRRVRQ
jgi:ABC-2 type transport system ATP-binding protein